MKQFFSLLVAGLIGGAATVGGLKYYEEKNNPKESLVKTEMPVAKLLKAAKVLTIDSYKSKEMTHFPFSLASEVLHKVQVQE